jgi:RNA polymerase sigma-70 factor (sigma-E family)
MASTDEDEAFRAFVNGRWRALVATAWLVTADRQVAEDCVQDALVAVHRHWPRVHRDGNPEAYARRAVLNSALSWRRKRRLREITVDQVPDVRAAAQAHDEIDPDLVAALRALPPRMRAVVALRFVEDRSEAETAGLLGCSVGTVKSAAHKGLAKLRQALTEPVDQAAPADEPAPSDEPADAVTPLTTTRAAEGGAR